MISPRTTRTYLSLFFIALLSIQPVFAGNSGQTLKERRNQQLQRQADTPRARKLSPDLSRRSMRQMKNLPPAPAHSRWRESSGSRKMLPALILIQDCPPPVMAGCG